MRALGCIWVFVCAVSMTGCLSSQGYMVNRAGQTFYERGNYAQAAMEFQRAVATDPYNADYIANLASALKKQGNLPAAEQSWRQALNINPSHQPSYHGLAQMMIENNRQQEASQLLTSWAQAQPYSAEPHLEMAWLNREAGNAAGTQQSLQQALSISPNHPKALASMGQYYQDVGQMAAATSMYQRSLQNNWYQPEVQSRLATLKGFESPTASPAMTTQVAANQGMRASFPPVPQFARSQPIQSFGQQMAFRPTSPFAQAAMPQLPAAQMAYGQQQPNMVMQQPPQAQMVAAAPAEPWQQAQMGSPVDLNHVFTPMMAAMPPQPAVIQYPQVSGSLTTGDPFATDFIGEQPMNVVQPNIAMQPNVVFQPDGTVTPAPGVPVPVPDSVPPPTPGAVPQPQPAPQVSSVPAVTPF